MDATRPTQDELIDDLCRQADATLRAGDLQGARQIYEAVLQLDPGHARAREGMERAGGHGSGDWTAEAPPALTGRGTATAAPPAAAARPDPVSLELDLQVAPPVVPSPSVTQPVLVRPAPPPPLEFPEEREAHRDFLDAARDLNSERAVQGGAGSPELDQADPKQGEAALVISRAREEFENGHLDEARQLAARALTIASEATGADELLQEIRNVTDRAAREAEELLAQGIAEFERGRPDLAAPLLAQVLVLVPGHAEATDYLAKAEVAREHLGLLRNDNVGHEHGAIPVEAGVAAIPLQSGKTVPPAGKADGGSLAGTTASLPVEPQLRVAARRPTPAVPKAAAAPRLAKRLVSALGGFVLVGALGAGGWYGWQSWSARPRPVADPKPAQTAPVPKRVPKAAAPAPVQPKAAPIYRKEDVPGLLLRAQESLGAGDEAGAVAALDSARRADPQNLDVIDRYEKARTALRNRQQAEAMLKDAKDRYAQEDFEEALRLLYRIPQGRQPAGLNRWIQNGWYNLGVQRLQTGDLGEAQEFFSNCLEVQPQDAGAKSNLEVVKRYRGKPTDDAYRIFVRGLALRPLDG